MFDLKCKRQGCVYNENCSCTANHIDVGRETECQTYEDCGYRKVEQDEVKQNPTRKNIKVGCRADCLFNDNNYCKANGITVITNEQHPECSTFMPK